MSALSVLTPISPNTRMLDVNKIRQDFPILQQKINGKPLIYLDNAATSQKPRPVIEAMDQYYRVYNSNVHRAVHTLGEKATFEFEAARRKVQRYINANRTQEIIFTRGATDSINLVAQSYGRSQLKAGDEIIITQMEHHSNIVPWQLLATQMGACLKVLKMNDKGEVNSEDFKNLISPRTKIVALIHVSNSLGTINPVQEMIAIAHQHKIPVLIDGAQAVPHMPIDVQALDCDFYVFSGHKLFASTGIGILYGKEAILEIMPPYQGGGEMIQTVTFEKTTFHELPHKFEAGTPNISGAIALGAAIDYLQTIGMANIMAYEQQLLRYAQTLAAQTENFRIIGNAAEKASILSFTLGDIHPHDIGTILDQEGIAIRTGHHCTMPVMQYFNIPATARASFAFYNTEQEIKTLFDSLDLVKKVFA